MLENKLGQVEALKALENLSKVKQQEIYCPTANLRAINTPLLASDDLMLRTTVSAVDTYDQELTILLFKHTTFPTMKNQLDIEGFMNCLSHLDRQVILWGIFASSYETLGNQSIECPHCGKEWDDEVTAKEIIQEDSLVPWEKEVPFNEYLFPVSINVEGVEGIDRLVFYTSIPTIAQHLEVLNLIPGQKLRDNFEKFGAILSKTEELASVTRKIELYATNDPEEKPSIWASPRDVHMVISQYVLLGMVDNVLDQYNTHFEKYVPNFKKPYVCKGCGKKFDFNVDIEIGLFRRFLQGGS